MFFVMRRVIGIILIVIGLVGIVVPVFPGIIPLLVGVEIAGLTMLLPGPVRRWRDSFHERWRRRPPSP